MPTLTKKAYSTYSHLLYEHILCVRFRHVYITRTHCSWSEGEIICWQVQMLLKIHIFLCFLCFSFHIDACSCRCFTQRWYALFCNWTTRLFKPWTTCYCCLHRCFHSVACVEQDYFEPACIWKKDPIMLSLESKQSSSLKYITWKAPPTTDQWFSLWWEAF